MRRTSSPLVLAVAFALCVLAFSGTAHAERGDSGLKIVVSQGTSERFGGGDWVLISVGDTVFGVIYGNEETPRPITIFGEYKRYIGGAEIYDERGNYIKTTPIPVSTVFSQTLINAVEFTDLDSDGLYDFRRIDSPLLSGDAPVKFLSLAQSWELSGWKLQKDDKEASLDFSLSLAEIPYTWVVDPQTQLRIDGRMRSERVEEITITFHIRVSIAPIRAENIPWYKVTVGGLLGREFLASERVGYKSFDGTSINMSFKYDHLIQGWDFQDNKTYLAMGTVILAGNLVDVSLARLIHEEMRLKAVEEDGAEERYEVRETDAEPDKPVLIEKNKIQFYDDWYRLGRLTWVSYVEVDGNQERMRFEVYGLGPATWLKNDRIFKGFQVKGAFVYPQGENILHDPEFSDSVLIFSIPSLTNILPPGVMLLQVAVGATGLGIAVILSMKRKKAKGGE